MRLLFGCALTTLLSVSAAAQPPTNQLAGALLVLPAFEHADQRKPTFALARRIERLLQGRGARVLDPERSLKRFVAEHSRDSAEVSAERAQELVRQGNEALDALKQGDEDSFVRHLRRVESLVEGALEVFVRREPEQLYRLCILDVRNSVLAGDEETALRKAQACDAKFPSYVPDSAPPPDVQAVLQRAAEKRREANLGALTVRSAPPGCHVYINGNRLGETPFTQYHPPAGPRLVQVECPSGATTPKGRVHTVTLGEDPQALHVDVDFERAVQTKNTERIYLRYMSSPQTVSATTADAIKIANIVGAQETVLIQPVRGGGLYLHRISDGWDFTVPLPSPSPSSPELEAALTALFAQGEETSALQPTPAAKPPESAARTRVGVGIASAAAAAGLYGAAWALHIKRTEKGRLFRQTIPSEAGYLARGDRWIDARPGPYLTAALAVPFGAVGLDLLLYPYTDTVTLPVLAGAAAAGLVAWGAFELARGGPCHSSTSPDRRACVLSQERRDRGALLLLTAAPLVQLPFFALAKRLSPERRVRLSMAGAGLYVTGEF